MSIGGPHEVLPSHGHRSAWRAYWRWKSRRGPGRPHIPAEWQRLILRIATEHPRWGAVRIVGELRALGFEVSAPRVGRTPARGGRGDQPTGERLGETLVGDQVGTLERSAESAPFWR